MACDDESSMSHRARGNFTYWTRATAELLRLDSVMEERIEKKE